MFRRSFRCGVPATAVLAIVLITSPASAQRESTSREAVVVVVAASSPVREISRLHLADLYLGRTTRFPNGEAAVPIDQRAGTGARAAFLEAYLDRSESQMKSYWSKLIFTGRGRPPRAAADDRAVKQLIAGDPTAIGYLDPGAVDASLRRVRVR